MEHIMTYETLSYFAYSNDQICRQPIRGIVLDFFGLGVMKMYDTHTENGLKLAEQGIILLVPYNNPWCWMNRQAVAYTDELIDLLFAHYNLPEDTPIVSTGGSMGGLSALVYTRYAKHTPVACVANCPVCDLPYHYTERPDLPSTLYSAFWNYEGTLDDAMKATSPLHLADSMPDVDYHIFHCEEDTAVNKQKHSDRFVAAMRPAHRLTYYPIPQRNHCDLPPEVWEQYWQLAVSAILNR